MIKMTKIKEILSKEMFDEIIKSQQNVVIDLHAEWCGPCKRLSKPLEELAVKYADTITFFKLNIDHMEEMGIDIEMPETIPTILYYKKGQEIERLSTSDLKTIENNFILF
jgi:thioredoxin 1